MGIHSADLYELVARAPSIDNRKTTCFRRTPDVPVRGDISVAQIAAAGLAGDHHVRNRQPKFWTPDLFRRCVLQLGRRREYLLRRSGQGRQLGRIGDIFIHNLSNRVLLHLIGVGEYDDFAHQTDCQ